MTARVAVVGAGVIGLTAAVALQRRGHEVVLIDRDPPGTGCSSGNAGVIATSFVLPLSSPGHLLSAPRMLLDPVGPLSVRVRDLPWLSAWLAAFVLNALPARQRRTIEALKAINGSALAAWRTLLADVNASDLLVERGMLEVVPAQDDRAARSLEAHAARLEKENIPLERVGAGEGAELEPLLTGRIGGGILHNAVAHVRDPAAVNAALLRHFREAGGDVLSIKVEEIRPDGTKVAVIGQGWRQSFDHAVLSAGYWSGRLLRGLGLRIPIGVERGYHYMLPATEPLPSRPIAFHAESFLATPLPNGLRLAGTVELARAESPPDWRRADQLARLVRRYMPQPSDVPGTRWMGCRPSFADGLPAIGRLSSHPAILYAFGHQHLGLTQAAVTAQLLADLIDGREPRVDPTPFDITRF